MPLLARANPATPCPDNGAHHPHRWVCTEPDCGCDYIDGSPYTELTCCVCGQDWPCDTKAAHQAARRADLPRE